jgi:UDP-glucose 6-dehydrogenase
MSKNIAVIGTGYVGLVAAVGLADFGNTVIRCDLDASFLDFFEFISKLYMLLEPKTK